MQVGRKRQVVLSFFVILQKMFYRLLWFSAKAKVHKMARTLQPLLKLKRSHR